MAIFLENSTKLNILGEHPFTREEEIKLLIEANLSSILSLQYVASEFRFKNFRIDTLAFDTKTKSFVIIEYKKKDKHSLVDQGFAYLAHLLRNKDAFTLKYNTALGSSLSKSEINWSVSKVLFISQSFTPFQQNLAYFKELPIELHLVKRYSGNVITLEKLTPAETLSLTNIPDIKSAPERKPKQKKNVPKMEHPLQNGSLTLELNKKLMKKVFGSEN